MIQDVRAQTVLAFWFGEPGTPGFGEPKESWFKKDPAFDEEIRSSFRDLHESAAQGGCKSWIDDPKSCLALVITLDQFPRNIFRGEARAFSTDAMALAAARHAIARGDDAVLVSVERLFLYLPFEHSENLADQRRAVALFESMPEHARKPEWIDYAKRHLVVVERFGRFPHRNAALGRASTIEEIEYLKQPNAGF